MDQPYHINEFENLCLTFLIQSHGGITRAELKTAQPDLFNNDHQLAEGLVGLEEVGLATSIAFNDERIYVATKAAKTITCEKPMP